MPNGKPYPKCGNCKGVGQVVLFTSSEICDCVNHKPIEPKVIYGIKKLQLSADYIADGILTWNMWPGIEGHTCKGCEVEMNVLGMSYNHWCPICDPDGKKYIFSSMSGHGRMPFKNPTFGPSQETITEGGRKADARRNKNG